MRLAPAVGIALPRMETGSSELLEISLEGGLPLGDHRVYTPKLTSIYWRFF